MTDIKKKIKESMLRKENLAECFFALLIIIMGTYRLGELTMPIIFNDEFGYWSNSMLLTGQDWSEFASKISYYSYGYSLILYLVRGVAGLLGYGWIGLYQIAVVFNIFFVVAGYFLSVEIAKRYMRKMDAFTIAAVCFVAAIYPSNMIYTHITLTESALTFFFWLFAYTLMRVVDMPGTANHIALAFLAVYLYAIHQRAIGLVVTAVLMVMILRLLKINSLKQAVLFMGSLYFFYILHSMVKAYVKQTNYLGIPVRDFGELLQMVFTKPVLAMFVAVIAAVIWLYILEKGRLKLSLVLLMLAVTAVVGAGLKGIGIAVENNTEQRIAVNELSGQIQVLRNVFSKYGMLRLGTSIVGKWYYLTAATGLVICWGLRDLFLNAVFMMVDGCRQLVGAVRGREHGISRRIERDFRRHLFLLGIFLSFASAFMVCALYKEGLYKVDDLINGRYIEYLIGFVIIYSIDRLMSGGHWMWFWLVCLAAHLAAGAYCQYVYDQLQRTEYELIHAVMFGRVFWNYESPTGKIREVEQYVLPMAAGFMLVSRAGAVKFGGRRLAAFRMMLALMLPVIAWNHIYTEIVDNYVVVRNMKQSGAAPQIASWVARLSDGEPIYFVNEGLSRRQGEILQYMCEGRQLILTDFGNVDFSEDALFILNNKYLDDDIIKEYCEVVDSKGSYALVVNNSQGLMERWRRYAEYMKPKPGEYADEN